MNGRLKKLYTGAKGGLYYKSGGRKAYVDPRNTAISRSPRRLHRRKRSYNFGNDYDSDYSDY